MAVRERQGLDPAARLTWTAFIHTESAKRDELVSRAGAVLDSIQRKELDVRIGATFALADAAEAHRALEGRETTGKVLLVP